MSDLWREGGKKRNGVAISCLLLRQSKMPGKERKIIGTLEKIIISARQDLTQEINSMENIGPAVSKSLHDFFTDKNNLNFIKKLERNGVIIESAQKLAKGKFTGYTFVLTGTLTTMSRE